MKIKWKGARSGAAILKEAVPKASRVMFLSEVPLPEVALQWSGRSHAGR